MEQSAFDRKINCFRLIFFRLEISMRVCLSTSKDGQGEREKSIEAKGCTWKRRKVKTLRKIHDRKRPQTKGQRRSTQGQLSGTRSVWAFLSLQLAKNVLRVRRLAKILANSPKNCKSPALCVRVCVWVGGCLNC